MKKIIVFLLLLGAIIALLWWLGKENENNDLVILTYDQEIPNINVDIPRIIEALNESEEVSAEENINEPRVFSLEDIKTSLNKEDESLYPDRMEKILSPLKNQPLNEGRIVLDTLNNKNTVGLEEIEKTRLVYKKITEELLLVSVPEKALKVHLDILSLSENISFRLSKMQQILSQPIIDLENTTSYYLEIKAMNQALINLNRILNQTENADNI